MPLKKKHKTSLTDFEWDVLRVTTQIPFGETRSYAWVARKVGRPKAVRAVGQALHKNPCLLIIPCHRVIQKSGRLGGYAGGIKNKKILIETERGISKQFFKK